MFGSRAAALRHPAFCILWMALLLLPTASRAVDPADLGRLRVLIVGGGPDLLDNQVAIESNVRYVSRLLPAGTVRTTLFADGKPDHASVLYDDTSASVATGERILRLALEGRDADVPPARYRRPNVGGRLDGASRRADIISAFSEISQSSTARRPVLLFFTGHGSPDRTNFENNYYDLWSERDNLSVHELAAQIARLPSDVPVTIVMVQCFSGAFGNLILEGGDPAGNPTERDLAGFFATVKERVAAGCTSAIDEEDYHDFTSYFFAALTGRDRVGRRVTGADYNGDGRVGMDEAFCYTLIHDDSIDVPVATSDVYLRRFVPCQDREVFQTPYRAVRSWATPAQKAALDSLASQLDLHTDDRLNIAYNRMVRENADDTPEWSAQEREVHRRLDSLRREDKAIILGRWPDLRLAPTSAAYLSAHKSAVAALTQEADQGKWGDLLDAESAVDRSEMTGEKSSIALSHVMRFVRLAKSVILAHRLRESGTPALRARFERLLVSEGRTPLPPVDEFQQASVP